MAAGHAEPQVDPGVAELEAVFTAVGAGCDFFDLIEMCAVHDRFIVRPRRLMGGSL